MTILEETDVLSSLNPSIQNDSDQWPEFVLKNVKVISPETNKPASLLVAHGEYPLRVEGSLEEVDPEDLGIGRYTKLTLFEL